MMDGVDAVASSGPGDRWVGEPDVDATDLPPRALEVGGYLDDLAGFDPGFFGLPGADAACADPQHRMFLEVAWQSLEHAGIPPRSLAGACAGIFTGLSHSLYALRLRGEDLRLQQQIGGVPSGAPGLVSYVLNTQGPTIAVEAACASGLAAIHMGCQALVLGECDVALAGGVNANLDRIGTASFTRAGMLSPEGRSYVFDARADGFVRSEGCGVVALKRLADAQRDGDRVLALVRGSAVGHVGRSRGIFTPWAPAQLRVMRYALARSGVPAERVGFVEAHGTGTEVGDPVEFEALTPAYGTGAGRCALGSAKTNVGHTEAAAGAVGFIKAVMALRSATVPPNIHFESWNPEIDPTGTRFFVPTEATDWPVAGTPRFAAVSAFGLTGINAHAVLEQAPPARRPRRRTPREGERVYPLSGASKSGLAKMSARIAAWMGAAGANVALPDVAHTLAAHRSHEPARACIVAAGRSELVAGLEAVAAGDPHARVVSGRALLDADPVWVFSGHGSQWAGMGRTLLDDPVFAGVIDELEQVGAEYAGPSLHELLVADEVSSAMDVVQPLLFAMQVGLAAVWRAHGVRPAAVVGHSIGEVSAAVAAGILTPAQGMRVTILRSRMLAKVGGVMAVVGLPADEVAAEIAGGGHSATSVAVVNSPHSTVVAGPAANVERLIAVFADRGAFTRQVAVTVAAHTPLVEAVLDELGHGLADLVPAPASVKMYSTALGDPRAEVIGDASYWVANLRSPVRFDRATAALLADGHELFLELSPQPMLVEAVEECGAAHGHAVRALATLQRDEQGPFARHLAQLHCAGGRIDWTAVHPDGELVDVPTRAFERRPFWIKAAGLSGAGAHPLLGTRVAVPQLDAGAAGQDVWRGQVGTAAHPWLADHKAGSTPVFPAAAYVEMALAAGCELFRCRVDELSLHDLRFEQLLLLADEIEVHAATSALGIGRARFEIFTRDGDGEWTRHAQAELRRCYDVPARAPTPEPPPPAEALPEEDADRFYRRLAGIGLDYGPAFCGVKRMFDACLEPLTLAVDVELPEAVGPRRGRFHVHPALLDSCLQSLAASILLRRDDGIPWFPVGIEAVHMPADPARIAVVRTELGHLGDSTASGVVHLFDRDGVLVGQLKGVSAVRVETSVSVQLAERLFEIGWEQSPLGEPAVLGEVPRWLVVADDRDPDVGAAVARELTARGGLGQLLVTGDGDPDSWAQTVLASLTSEDTPWHGVVLCSPAPRVGVALDPIAGRDLVCRVLALVRAHAAGQALPRLWLATRAARAVVTGEAGDPGQAALRGLLRVLAAEHPELRVTLVDADAAGAASDVAAELLADGDEDEIAWREGVRLVARLARKPLRDSERIAERAVVVRYGEDGFALRDDALIAVPRRPPGPGEVEIQVRVAALDVEPHDRAGLTRAVDCGGVICAIGAGVEHVRTGDRVIAAGHGRPRLLCSFATLPAALVVGVPDDLSLTDAATLVVPHLTASHALDGVARLCGGETLLVHGAAGAIGLAAVALARDRGARVIATDVTELRRAALRELGTDAVVDGGSPDLADEVLRMTGGRGVDVVLNCLDAQAVQASVALLAPDGRFVDLGQRGPAKLELTAGVGFTRLDLSGLAERKPEQYRRLLEDAVATRARHVAPHRTCRMDDCAAEVAAFAAGEHAGRLVLTLPAQGATRATVAPSSSAVVRPAGAYVITGGLRGLGLEAAAWLAGHGAARIVLNGRSRPDEDALERIAGLRRAATQVEIVLGDVAEHDTAVRLVAAATAGGHALRGVLHCAVVLDDAPAAELTDARVDAVWLPKVLGAWRLHEATAGHELDWWVGFSSQTSAVGNPGQANYAAAGAWLDAFAAWRRAHGLHALAIDWGFWGEAGRARKFADFIDARGVLPISNKLGFDALEQLLVHDRVCTGVYSFVPHKWFAAFPAAASSSLFAHIVDRDALPVATSSAAADAVLAADAGPRRRLLVQAYLLEQLGLVLGVDPDDLSPQATFTNVGVDSLLAVQMRNQIRTALGVELTVRALWANPCPAQLAEHLDRQLAGARDDIMVTA